MCGSRDLCEEKKSKKKIGTWEDFKKRIKEVYGPDPESSPVLDLDDRGLSSWEGCPELKRTIVLYLRNNQISSWKDCPTFPNVRIMFFSGNPIKSWEGCPKFPELEGFELGENHALKSWKGCPRFPKMKEFGGKINDMTYDEYFEKRDEEKEKLLNVAFGMKNLHLPILLQIEIQEWLCVIEDSFSDRTMHEKWEIIKIIKSNCSNTV